MPSWVGIVLVIALVLAAGFFRDNFRTAAIRRWCPPRGFQFLSTTAEELAALTTLAMRFRPANASQWGIVLRKTADGVETTIAEHAERPSSGGIRWYTLVVTKVPGMNFDPVRIVPAPSSMVRRATDAAMAPGREVRTRLGIEVTETPAVVPVGQGKWAVDAEDPAARTFWTSDAQAAAIDAWPHGGGLAAVGDCVLFRVPGLMAATRLDEVLHHAGEARALFVRAATFRPRQSPGQT